MYELFQESIRPVNLPYTMLFGLCLFYWASYLVGVVGSDLLDFDLDADIDGDAGGELDGVGDGGGSILGALMRFVYAADVPVTVIASVLSAVMWAYSLLANRFLGPVSEMMVVLISIPILLGGIVTTKIVLMPFVPLLKKAFDESSDTIPVIGKLCVVSSLEATEKHGQAEVPLKGSPLLLNVRTGAGVVMEKGQEAVVFAKEEDGIYLIAPFDGDANVTKD